MIEEVFREAGAVAILQQLTDAVLEIRGARFQPSAKVAIAKCDEVGLGWLHA